MDGPSWSTQGRSMHRRMTQQLKWIHIDGTQKDKQTRIGQIIMVQKLEENGCQRSCPTTNSLVLYLPFLLLLLCMEEKVGFQDLWNCFVANENMYLPFTIYHQSFFHSVRRNPSLNCFHRRRSLAILGHAGPKWRIRLSLHLVLGLPCCLNCPFSWCPLCHSFSPSVIVESCNVSRPSVYSLLDNVYGVIYTCLMSYINKYFEEKNMVFLC